MCVLCSVNLSTHLIRLSVYRQTLNVIIFHRHVHCVLYYVHFSPQRAPIEKTEGCNHMCCKKVGRVNLLIIWENEWQLWCFVFVGSASTTSAGCVWTTGAAIIHQLVATLSKPLCICHIYNVIILNTVSLSLSLSLPLSLPHFLSLLLTLSTYNIPISIVCLIFIITWPHHSRCNRYDAQKKAHELLIQRKDKINAEYEEIEKMGKFLHYFERYKGHGQSLEVRQ